jgi:hypothetical protein
MSTRTNLTVRNQGQYPELGATVKTFENMDVTNGNKVLDEPGLCSVLHNTSVSSRTVTYTYDDQRGEVRTKILTLAAGEAVLVQYEENLTRHAADAAEHGYVWLTASGSAGDVKVMTTRLVRTL